MLYGVSLFLVCYGGVNYATLMPLYNKQSGGRKQGCDSCVIASTSQTITSVFTSALHYFIFRFWITEYIYMKHSTTSQIQLVRKKPVQN